MIYFTSDLHFYHSAMPKVGRRLFETAEEKFVLFHFPIEAWSGYGRDRIHLHGHLHRLEPVCEPIRRYEVGVDAHDGRPVSIDTIWEQTRELHNWNRKLNGVWE